MKSLAYPSLLVLAGCLSVPDGPAPMCNTSADCNTSAGEVCDEGVCWGNPPPGPFAAALGAPADGVNVVATEIPLLAIPEHGWVGDLVLDTPVVVGGRLEAYCPPIGTCDHSTIGATIKVHRDSLFYGGPGFTKVFTAKANVAAGKTDSFSLELPRSHDGDPIYAITIEPDGRGDMPATNGTTTAAELVPPLYMESAYPDSVSNTTITLGGMFPTITGYLIDANSQPLLNYRVVALGHWTGSDPLTEVSTVDYSTDGRFSITLSNHITGSVEIVAKPWNPTVVAPTLRLGGVEPTVSSQRTLAQPAGLGNRLAVTIPVKGVSGSGEYTAVPGAKVIVAGSYSPQLGAGARAELVVEALTDAAGNANLTLLDGAAISTTYKVRVIPPASSELGIVFDQPLTVGQVTIPPVRLPSRLALSGRVVDITGKPLGNVSVTARPSLRFQWSLEADPQQFLASIPTAPIVTPDTGDFVVWVDPYVADIWGHYDLDFEPPPTANAATWTMGDVEIKRVSQATQSLDTITAPDAAFIHGRITDVLGSPVEKAELRVFQIVTNTTLCAQVPFPGDCVIPAQLQGHGTSDPMGIARLTLPRP